jgi:hypothetical protein
LQRPLDGRTEGGDRKDQSQATAIVDNVDTIPIDLSEHRTEKPTTKPQMTNVYFAETPPHINPARVGTTLEQTERKRTKRKRITCCEIDGSTYQGHRPLAGKLEALSDLPPKILDKLQRIGGPEILATLWYYFRALRCSLRMSNGEQNLNQQIIRHEHKEQLLWYQLQYKNIGVANDYFPELHRRLYCAKIDGLYSTETLARRQARKRRRTKKDDSGRATSKFLFNIFIDFHLPQLQEEGDTRKQVERRFENWKQLGRPYITLYRSSSHPV